MRARDPQLALREEMSRVARDGGEARSTDETANHRRGKEPQLKDDAASDEEQGEWR